MFYLKTRTSLFLIKFKFPVTFNTFTFAAALANYQVQIQKFITIFNCSLILM